MSKINIITFKKKIFFLFNELIPKLFENNMKYITLLNIISATGHTVMSVFVIKYILDLAINKKIDGEKIIIISLIYTIIYIIFNILNRLMVNKAFMVMMEGRMHLALNMVKKVSMMDHEIYENPKEMLKVQQSFNAISGESFGYGYIFNTLFSLLPKLLIVLIFFAFLFNRFKVVILVVFIGLVSNFVIAAKVAEFMNNNRDNVDKEERKINAYIKVAKDFAYGKDIRVYTLRDSLLKNINKFTNNYVNVKKKEFMYKFKLSFFENIILKLTDFISFIVLINLAINGAIKISDVVMIISMIILFTNTVYSIKEDISNIYTQIPYVINTYDFYNSNLYINKNGKYIKIEEPVDIKFDNVSYKYPGSEKYVFENISFNIEAGKKVALVGVNGAGKTTIIKLMTGLAKPVSGNIYINGINSKELSDKAIFDLYSAVFQETEPLALTIAENISCVEDGIDFDKVENKLKQVGLWEKISGYKYTYNSNMLKVIYDDGLILSGGENQKLMISRALYKDGASVMLMDEPTSALDAFAEEKIYEDFESYMGEKTGVFISHRLGSTRFCDEIIFLDDGHIIAQGKHEDLINSCSKYRDMFETQGKYYKESINEEI